MDRDKPHLSPIRFDRYIVTELFKPFLGACALFFFLFFMFQTYRIADEIIVHHVSGWVAAKIAFYLLLSFSGFVFPVGFLTSTLIGFGRLSADSELVALKASGYGVARAALPALCLAACVSLFSLCLAMSWAPWGERELEQTLARMATAKVATQLKEKTFNSGFYDLLLYADQIDSHTGALKRVFLYDESEKEQPNIVVARSGEVLSVVSNNDFGGQIMLRLFNGKIYRLDPSNTLTQIIGFKEYKIYRTGDESDEQNFNHPRMTSYRKLLAGMRAFDHSSQDYRYVATEFWKRFSVSLSPLFFCILGIGLGTVRTRAVQGRGILFTVLTMIVYWETLVYFNALADEGHLWIPFALQVPNLVVAAVGAIGFKKASW